MAKVRVLVLRAAGTNCDIETAFAFKLAGAESELVHINRLKENKKQLEDYQILAIPGGFTYGDDIASGKILANELICTLLDKIREFLRDADPIKNINQLLSTTQKVGELLIQIDKLEDKVKRDLQDQSKIVGSKTKAIFEDGLK